MPTKVALDMVPIWAMAGRKHACSLSIPAPKISRCQCAEISFRCFLFSSIVKAGLASDLGLDVSFFLFFFFFFPFECYTPSSVPTPVTLVINRDLDKYSVHNVASASMNHSYISHLQV